MTTVLKQDPIDLFIASQTAYSPNTKKNYRLALERIQADVGVPLLKWGNAEVVRALETIKARKVKRRVDGVLVERPPKQNAVKDNFERVRSFFKWAATAHLISRDANPCDGVKVQDRADDEPPTIYLPDFVEFMDRLRRDSQNRSNLKGGEAERQMVERVYKVTKLLWDRGLRPGELLCERPDQHKLWCSCGGSGVDCPLGVHDFRRLGGGMVSIKVKAKPEQTRYEPEDMTKTETEWLDEIVKEPPFTVQVYDDNLARLANERGIRLVSREGEFVEGRVTAYSVKRTLVTLFNERDTPEALINRRMHWVEKSTQSRRYGKLTPKKVSEKTDWARNLGKLGKEVKRRKEAEARPDG